MGVVIYNAGDGVGGWMGGGEKFGYVTTPLKAMLLTPKHPLILPPPPSPSHRESLVEFVLFD